MILVQTFSKTPALVCDKTDCANTNNKLDQAVKKNFPGNENGKAAPASHKGINHTYKLKL